MSGLILKIDVSPDDVYVISRAEIDASVLEFGRAGKAVLLIVRNALGKIGGVRLSPEIMDQLVLQYLKERRLCPFCGEPELDLQHDERGAMHEIYWWCTSCNGQVTIQLEEGDTPYDGRLTLSK